MFVTIKTKTGRVEKIYGAVTKRHKNGKVIVTSYRGKKFHGTVVEKEIA